MALNSNALTTLALAKAYLKIPTLETSQDAMVELFINAASEMLEKETDRVLKQRVGIVEYQDGRKQNIIVLKQFPVTAISEVKIDSESNFAADTLVDPADYEITDDGNALLYVGGVFSSGHRGVKVTYTAGYNPVPSDLEHACLWLVFWYAKIRDAADIGRSTKNKEGESISYLQSAPDDVKNCILRYKRTECLTGNASIYNG